MQQATVTPLRWTSSLAMAILLGVGIGVAFGIGFPSDPDPDSDPDLPAEGGSKLCREIREEVSKITVLSNRSLVLHFILGGVGYRLGSVKCLRRCLGLYHGKG